MTSGCGGRGPDYVPTERERVEQLGLMLPYELKIQPFSKVASFNEDQIPDGILAVVRPLDRFGDPVKAVGPFYFELWTYENATAERRGTRLAFWERNIATRDDVRLYWNRTQMYEFQLAWTQGIDSLPPNRKYLLTVTYRSPWEETMRDEYVLDFHLPPLEFLTAGATPPPATQGSP